jgi:hypothetical protein
MLPDLQAPRPYVFEVPLKYQGKQQLELGLILVGKAVDFLPYFIYVLNEIGKLGLGVGQVPYRLLAVLDGSHPDGSVVFDAQEQVLQENFSAIVKTWTRLRLNFCRHSGSKGTARIWKMASVLILSRS